jgi:hypothetical protein
VSVCYMTYSTIAGGDKECIGGGVCWLDGLCLARVGLFDAWRVAGWDGVAVRLGCNAKVQLQLWGGNSL